MAATEQMDTQAHGPKVLGIAVDPETRCAHWHGPTDIIALRMKCCGDWFSCYDCHTQITNHPALTWPKEERATGAILCGACGTVLSIDDYLVCESICPNCDSPFNPGCAIHHHLYFEII